MARGAELIPLDRETLRRAREILFMVADGIYDLCGELRDVSEAYLDQVTYEVLEVAFEDLAAYIGQLIDELRETREEADALQEENAHLRELYGHGTMPGLSDTSVEENHDGTVVDDDASRS